MYEYAISGFSYLKYGKLWNKIRNILLNHKENTLFAINKFSFLLKIRRRKY